MFILSSCSVYNFTYRYGLFTTFTLKLSQYDDCYVGKRRWSQRRGRYTLHWHSWHVPYIRLFHTCHKLINLACLFESIGLLRNLCALVLIFLFHITFILFTANYRALVEFSTASFLDCSCSRVYNLVSQLGVTFIRFKSRSCDYSSMTSRKWVLHLENMYTFWDFLVRNVFSIYFIQQYCFSLNQF